MKNHSEIARVCILCGGERHTPVHTSQDYLTGRMFATVKCSDCQLIFVDPKPASAELRHLHPVQHQQMVLHDTKSGMGSAGQRISNE